MTDAISQTYERVFPTTNDVTTVLDDITRFINAMPLEHQAGAMRLLTYVLLKRSAARRDKQAGPKKESKGKLNAG